MALLLLVKQANGLLAAKKRRASAQRAKTAASPMAAATPGSDYYGAVNAARPALPIPSTSCEDTFQP